MHKKIDFILNGREKSIGSESVLQALPHKDFRFANPFIVLHHMRPHYYPPDSPPQRLHPHPHRGFAPVTFLFEGEGYHKDSAGNSGVIKGGEVQWMFAGKGLLHSEGPTKSFLKKGGHYELVQIWVNVPAKHKLDEPYYKQATKQQMPDMVADEGVDLKLVSGHYNNLQGPIQSFTPVITAMGNVAAGKQLLLTATEGYWTLLYILEGEAIVNSRQVSGQQLVVFSKQDTDIAIVAQANTKLLYLSAEPINEPVAAKGNMVMNTAEEIEQAEKDYKDGLFGTLDQ